MNLKKNFEGDLIVSWTCLQCRAAGIVKLRYGETWRLHHKYFKKIIRQNTHHIREEKPIWEKNPKLIGNRYICHCCAMTKIEEQYLKGLLVLPLICYYYLKMLLKFTIKDYNFSPISSRRRWKCRLYKWKITFFGDGAGSRNQIRLLSRSNVFAWLNGHRAAAWDCLENGEMSPAILLTL